MRQAIITAKEQVEFSEKEIPALNEGEALLKTLISGISAGTEGMWYNASASALKSGRKNYPYFPGYELVGEVIKTGGNARFQSGDIVFAMKPHGSFAVVNANDIAYKLPADFAPENALAIALTGTAIHAIDRANISEGDKAAVIGMGILGFILTQVLTNAFGANVTAISGSEDKLELAKKLGAVNAISHATAADAAVNAAFDASGTNSGINLAVKAAGNYGKVVAAGFYNEPISIDGEALFAKELTVYGVRGTGAIEKTKYDVRSRAETMQLASELVLSGKVKINDLITHKFKAADIKKAYELIESRNEPFLQIMLEWD